MIGLHFSLGFRCTIQDYKHIHDYVSNEDAIEFEQVMYVHTSTSYMWIRLRLWFYLYKLRPCLQIDYARQTSMGCSTRRSLSCMRATTVEILNFLYHLWYYIHPVYNSLCLSYLKQLISLGMLCLCEHIVMYIGFSREHASTWPLMKVFRSFNSSHIFLLTQHRSFHPK